MLAHLSFLHIVAWTDVLEIGIFSTVVFIFSRWLAHDQKAQLLTHFYFGCAGLIFAYLFNLHAIVHAYMYIWPALIVLFIIMHQKSLQKNYVAARIIKPAHENDIHEWLSIIMSAAFRSIHYKKDFIFIVEGYDKVNDYIHPTIAIKAPIQKALCDMIVESTQCAPGSYIIVTQHGTIRAIGSGWKQEIDDTWLINKHFQHEPQKQAALYWSNHFDALIFFVDTTTKLCTIIAQGTIVPDLSPEKTLSIITQYIRKKTIKHLIKQTHKEGSL
jgi:DNA integrity scanning protein DisA with diadenylate cyclase activity